MNQAIALCAEVDAAFHRMMYAALGIPVRTDGGAWWIESVATPLLAPAATLRPATRLPRLDPAIGEIRDCWGRLDLPGWVAEPEDPWLVRPAGPIAVPPVAGLVIDRARDPAAVLDFERAVIAAVGRTPPGHVDGAIHPPGPTAGSPHLHLLRGRIDGVTVATALAAVTPRGTSVGAVATAAELRGRGIGAAMTAAAVAVAPDKPATLLASPAGYSVYRRLGFRDVGRGLRWRSA